MKAEERASRALSGSWSVSASLRIIREVEEAVAERDAAWRKYARHLPTCKVRLAADLRTGTLDVTPCNCGLRALLEGK